MKIAVPIAAYETGTTGEYVARALRKLGHEANIMSQWDFYTAFKEDSYDLYFCVDSGGPLNLLEMEIATRPMHKLCFWMIDYRRGKTLKNPNDWKTCQLIHTQGGWVFQSQYEDFQDSLADGLTNVSWLPLGADLDVWSDEPHVEKAYDIGFAGNVWDPARASALDALRLNTRLGWMGHGGAKMEAGASLLRASWLGFNISSFFGEPVAYDVNMRVFETLACGVPLITNYVPSLEKLNLAHAPFIRTYNRLDEIVPLVKRCMTADPEFMLSGKQAREWAVNYGSYVLRMESALETVAEKILVPLWDRK
jgi:hypothetical protein